MAYRSQEKAQWWQRSLLIFRTVCESRHGGLYAVIMSSRCLRSIVWVENKVSPPAWSKRQQFRRRSIRLSADNCRLIAAHRRRRDGHAVFHGAEFSSSTASLKAGTAAALRRLEAMTPSKLCVSSQSDRTRRRCCRRIICRLQRRSDTSPHCARLLLLVLIHEIQFRKTMHGKNKNIHKEITILYT